MGEIVTIILMAGALGMDAFSISLGMGMLGLRRKQIFLIGFIIGVFHFFMPLLGMVAGICLTIEISQFLAQALLQQFYV